MNRRNAIATLAGTLLLWGCASAGGTGESTSNGDVIVRAELESLGAMGTLEAMQRLRPRFLRPRASTGTSRQAEYPKVYLDNLRLESVNDLRTLPTSEVFEIRYLDPNDATTRYGTGHTAGVILVTTLRRRG